jgi:hypothetical protein
MIGAMWSTRKTRKGSRLTSSLRRSMSFDMRRWTQHATRYTAAATVVDKMGWAW